MYYEKKEKIDNKLVAKAYEKFILYIGCRNLNLLYDEVMRIENYPKNIFNYYQNHKELPKNLPRNKKQEKELKKVIELMTEELARYNNIDVNSIDFRKIKVNSNRNSIDDIIMEECFKIKE